MCDPADSTVKIIKAVKKGKPAWLKKPLPKGGDYQQVTRILADAKLNTFNRQNSICP